MSADARQTADNAAAPDRPGVFMGLSSAAVIVWLAAGVAGAGGASCLETIHSGGVLLAVCLSWLLWRGAEKMAASALGRLWSTGLFLAAALALSAAFRHSVGERGLLQSGPRAQASALAPLGAALLLWLAWRIFRGRRSGIAVEVPDDGSAGRAAELERLFCSPAVRVHLAAVGVFLAAADVGLSGLPSMSVLPRAGVLGAFMLCYPALLRLAASPTGQRLLNGAVALALCAGVAMGVMGYAEVRAKAAAMRAHLAQDQEAEAGRDYQEALALNSVVRARGIGLGLELELAAYRERKGQYEAALHHWRLIAGQQNRDATEMPAVRRILCRMGDSITAWRRLIYQGFPAVADPELTPGIKALADTAGGDLRAKLLAALLSWEQHDPPEEVKRRLEDVRKLRANEPSACNLLRRLGASAADKDLYLPGELIVGKRPTLQTPLGTIEELGEAATIVVLNEGHWEIGLNARATPLNEEWPIIRIELNGHEIGRTQVNKAEEYEVPFTVDVNRGNIYLVRIVFENQTEELVQGRISRRGLVISGMSFRRAQD